MKTLITYLPLLALLCGSCKPGTGDHHEANYAKHMYAPNTPLSTAEYVAYVKDTESNLVYQKDIGDFRYTLQYIPAEYLALRELGTDSPKKEELAARTKDMSELIYFTLTVQNKKFNGELLRYNLNSDMHYQERLDYFSFRMQQDIQMIETGDTLSCELFHFERTYNLAPYLRFTLAFRNTGKIGPRTFSFDDAVFKTGVINMEIDPSTFENIPTIKTI